MTTHAAGVEVTGVSRRFGTQDVLTDVSLSVGRGVIHSLVGPNAAGKSTLLRILAGLTEPTDGRVEILASSPRIAEVRRKIGWVPAGDRSFYLRISGIENLTFFGRLHGMTRKEASERANRLFQDVGLTESSRRRVGLYSQGMVKRLAVARALMTAPEVLLFDEATHDLDPRGSLEIRELVRERARAGAAVVWATQRLEELTGFADTVTVLDQGVVRFQGSLQGFTQQAPSRRFRIALQHQSDSDELHRVRAALDGMGQVELSTDPGEYLVALAPGISLGDGIVSLTSVGFEVLSCSEERSEVESAFLRVTDGSKEVNEH